ncbi:hypothetical protein DevBK_20850 [Devosia sp. BK]|uniref:hypothetical protein n=1 Tax=Devosia sp. BK TaxID=2871706 RepID=UPI002939D3AA|nr:hypothetical protein [Devosia sp. BK]MDV3253797.1 hypothetical protein [Devosia sp. BK]
MRWSKKGLVWNASYDLPWALNSALTPTPIVLGSVIRVYAGFRDEFGVSRIGFVDLSAQNPTHVVGFSQKPALDIGRPGAFDDNGVILGHVEAVGETIRMYYVGFQKVEKAKFLAFTGLAISEDGGLTFQRYSEAPIIDRTNGSIMINALHSIRLHGDKWHGWVARGDGWLEKNGIPYPRYEIWEMQSSDGITFDTSNARKLIGCEGDEYRIGRPSVFVRPDGSYVMFYTAGYAKDDRYQAGMAVSADGFSWKRIDDEIGLSPGEIGTFDHLHLCYPRLVEVNGKFWAVYNGNNMGREGFGLAELQTW